MRVRCGDGEENKEEEMYQIHDDTAEREDAERKRNEWRRGE